jgi:hypothetical protein
MHPGLMEDLMYSRQAEFAQEAARRQRDHALRLARPSQPRAPQSIPVLRWLRQWRPQGHRAPVTGA